MTHVDCHRVPRARERLDFFAAAPNTWPKHFDHPGWKPLR